MARIVIVSLGTIDEPGDAFPSIGVRDVLTLPTDKQLSLAVRKIQDAVERAGEFTAHVFAHTPQPVATPTEKTVIVLVVRNQHDSNQPAEAALKNAIKTIPTDVLLALLDSRVTRGTVLHLQTLAPSDPPTKVSARTTSREVVDTSEPIVSLLDAGKVVGLLEAALEEVQAAFERLKTTGSLTLSEQHNVRDVVLPTHRLGVEQGIATPSHSEKTTGSTTQRDVPPLDDLDTAHRLDHGVEASLARLDLYSGRGVTTQLDARAPADPALTHRGTVKLLDSRQPADQAPKSTGSAKASDIPATPVIPTTAGNIMLFACRERFSEYADNAEIDHAPDGTSNEVANDEDFSAGKFPASSLPDSALKKVRAWFRCKHDIGNAAVPDDVHYLRWKIPYSNYLAVGGSADPHKNTIIGEFSNGFNSPTDWTESDVASNLIIEQSGVGYPSPKALRVDIEATDSGVLATLKQTDTFTTPANITGGVLKLRVKKNADVVSTVGETRIYVEFSDDNFSTVRLTCPIFKGITSAGHPREVDQGGASFTEADGSSEVVFTLDAVGGFSTGSALVANTAYRMRVRAEKTGGATNTTSIQRDLDYIRIEFPNGETSFTATNWNSADQNQYAALHDDVILDIRDKDSPEIGASLTYLYYDIKELHDPTVTGAGLSNTSFSANNIWDEGWASDGSNKPSGWNLLNDADAGSQVLEVVNNGDLRMRSVNDNDPMEIEKDVGHFPTKGYTIEFSYKIVEATADGLSGRFEVSTRDGSTQMVIRIYRDEMQYRDGLNFTAIASSSSTVGTTYVLRIIYFPGAAADFNKMVVFRRPASSGTWTRLGGFTTAGGAAAGADGAINIFLAASDTATFEFTMGYLAVARGRLTPMNALPKWSDLKRARLSYYREVGVGRDSQAVFDADAQGLEATFDRT